METLSVKKATIETFLTIYDFHTTQFGFVLEDISDADAQNRLNTKANHIGWLAGSLVYERYELARHIGMTHLKQTSHDLFTDHKGIQDGVTYPSLDEYRKDWKEISPVLRQAIADLSDDQLNGPDPYGMPGGTYTLFDAITFCSDRESYCIGQIGLWRRLLDYKPMRYA